MANSFALSKQFPLPAITLWVLLILPLVLAPVLGLLTPYLGMIIVVPLCFLVLGRGQVFEAYTTYGARIFGIVFALLAVVFAVTATSVTDVLRGFNFTMLLAYGPIELFMRRQAGRLAPERVAQLAFLGVLVGLVEVSLSFALLSINHVDDRATGPNIQPIVLANGVLALSVVAAGAVLIQSRRCGWLYLFAPIAALTTVFLTASRGPLLAVPAAALFAAVFIWRTRLGGGVRLGWLVLGILILGGVLTAIMASRSRIGSLAAIAEGMLSGATVGDEPARQRLVLYAAGWRAFLQSPWVGHGWANIMRSVRPLLPPGDADLGNLPHLHNDVMDFAVGAGAVGVLCYAAIITAPIVGALCSPRDRLRPFRLFAMTMLTIIYIGGGVTDLMFGFEFHTFLFVMLTAIVVGFCRLPEAQR